MKLTQTLIFGVIALSAIAAVGQMARADATHQPHLSRSVRPWAAQTAPISYSDTVTISYQGGNVRIQTANGDAMIYTGGKLYSNRHNESNVLP